MNIIPFGSLVRDRVTGFKGFVVARIEHMNDCIRYEVQPSVDKAGQLPESKCLEGPNLEIAALPKHKLPPAFQTPDVFNLGIKARDVVTGFTGVLVLRIKNMYAGDRYGLQPKMNKEGEIPKIEVFDEGDLEQIDPPLVKKEDKKKKKKPPAGPHDPNSVIAR